MNGLRHGADSAPAALLTRAPAARAAFELADRVVVRKAERKLYLMKGNTVLRSFKVALGLVAGRATSCAKGTSARPRAATPWWSAIRTATSSSPSAFPTRTTTDAWRARSKGHAPGGAIMIHGQPNNPTRSPEYYRRTDWTNGCIAVSNADMVDIWLMTARNTPIDILP